jgi:hypothetical protein
MYIFGVLYLYIYVLIINKYCKINCIYMYKSVKNYILYAILWLIGLFWILKISLVLSTCSTVSND